MNFGNVLKRLRKEAKMTQAGLAKAAGVSRTYLSDVENNRYNPSVDLVKKLSAALENSVHSYESIFTLLMSAANYSVHNVKDLELVSSLIKEYQDNGENAFLAKSLKDLASEAPQELQSISNMLLSYIESTHNRVGKELESELERIITNYFNDFALYDPSMFSVYLTDDLEKHINGLKEGMLLHEDEKEEYERWIQLIEKFIAEVKDLQEQK
ncbi:helix-turn-helix transcriptional regulator [Trichococcus pasteurii]|uniref:HTH cro/C1-type domain-containing protein n=1 Tax=Trichococcus pasteurii TaxID=43064 RepID=A0A1W1ID75_9LACT|nr:helix-turn-helix transcriptional regulator [Trichococcus pasteurii]SFE37192.1 DNA-binding transcriptional regulator, XRE-family HTH domain [Trichococcus pasteurii]SLM50861.1 Hypothetical protein TPAS_533 [Trichococcus pasteurii]SSB91742.1 Hypothetical protein TPAS_533 [Trichococcus pasteurii]